MDAANSSQINDFIAHSIARMDQQEENISGTGRAVQALVKQVSELTQQVQLLRTPTAPPTPPVLPPSAPAAAGRSEPRLPTPEGYSGEPEFCRAFLTRCSMHFALQPHTFQSEEAKVAFVLTLLSGRASLWGTAVWENKDDCCASFQELSEEMKRVFDRAVAGKEAARLLAELRQGEGSVADFSIRFRTLAAECRWNEAAQWDMFLHGLADRVQREIYAMDLPETLNGLVELALRVDARLNRVARLTRPSRPVFGAEDHQPGGASAVSPTNDHEPMQVGRARLSREERERRRSQGLCLYCGRAGHFIHSCPVKEQARLRWRQSTHCTSALLDSGAEGNFMDFRLAHRLQIPVTPLSHPIIVNALNGQELPRITHVTEDITLITSGNHTELISFFLMDSPLAPVVLGHPWLSRHNPGSTGALTLFPHGSEVADLSNVPAEYHDLKEVVSKSRAASLPPHRSYDCAIELLPGKSPPKGKLYSLSIPEREAMEKYISDSLASGFIQPSSSPAGAGFFFVGKKDGSLRPCIDYRGLNNITEHVQHVRRVLQRLLENGLFVKAEKCSFHAQSVPFLGYIISSEGVRVDPDKPTSRASDCLDFPRTTFRWSNTAEAVFTNLKSRFVSAPILVTPDPTRQFVVEVDASEVGVGAVLSQRASSDDKLHPCAFFSHRLSPAERNYDIGNRELLAVKLALEEWRHWLEGSGVPFIVWTDHKNLEYIRTAKRLNSRQARWALFFGRFDFVLSYRPGSKNIKPDSLSRIFDPSERPVTPECILPEKVVISTLVWEVESKVMTALDGVTPPPGCPPSRLFVPEGLRSDVIRWVTSTTACPFETLVPHRSRFYHRPPPSNGMTVVLTVVDRFSKAAHFIPLPKLPSAKETAVTVIDHVFRLHGLPMDVVSDRGSQFISKFWQEFCKLLGATVSLSSGYHPQSNGQSERANQDLERMLRCLVAKNPSSWSQQLSMVEYAHNSLPVSSTGLSPFKCSLGYQPPIFPSLESEVAVPSAHAFVQRCHRTWTRARETLLQAGRRMKAKADRHRSKPPVYVVGQKVWLSTKNIPLRSVSNKLAPKFIGPVPVTKIISPVTVRLKLPPAYRRIHPAFHVSKIKPVFRSHINPPAPVPPPPRLVDGEPTYSVNRILDSRRGGDADFSTWWTGRATVRRREVGYLLETSWITPLLMITIDRSLWLCFGVFLCSCLVCDSSGFRQYFVFPGFHQFLVSSGCSTSLGFTRACLHLSLPPDRHLVPASPTT
ncbi:retrotransposable element [Pimephales promelas]|nr:retrotransposable element [Pimephales promelas]